MQSSPPNLRYYLLGGGLGCLALVFLCAAVGLFVVALQNSDMLDLPYPDGPPPITPSPTVEQTRATPEASSINVQQAASPAATSPGTSFADTFDAAARSRFLVREDEQVRYAFIDERYLIEVKKPDTLVWSRAEGVYTALRIEVELVFVANAPLSAGGVMFHMQDGENFYLLSLASNGFYALDLYQNNRVTNLIDWTETKKLALAGKPNRLRLETADERIAIYLNGERLELTSDATFAKGELALAATSFAEAGAEVRFDNLRVTIDVTAPQ
jgi:hypothetical protein